VADVIQAVDGPVTVTACSETDHNCDQYTKCSIRDPLAKIKNRIIDALTTVSVAEMAAESDAPAPVQTHTVSRMMFVPSVGE
jgi:DNA-binding IscR family transcriptional regulator